jgi:hypothetical protein
MIMYLVTAVRDIYEETGVEVAGVFDTEAKAYEAKARVEEWMKDNEWDDCEVFVSRVEVNRLEWYEIEENF